MPVVAEFEGITVRMYYRDHQPPHFHVEYGGSEAELEIASLAVLAGDLPASVLRKVREWSRGKQAALALNWVKCQSHMKPDRL